MLCTIGPRSETQYDQYDTALVTVRWDRRQPLSGWEAVVSGLPRPFVHQIGSGLFLDIPIAVLLSLPVIVALYLLMAWSRYGRYVYAIGSNPKAALVAGVRIPLTLLITYVICGYRHPQLKQQPGDPAQCRRDPASSL